MFTFIIGAVAGIGVGILSGLLGIGGGTIMVPLFRLAFGMPPIAATATSLFTIVPTSISGMWKHHKNKTSLPRVGIACGIAGACLSPVGVWAASVSPGWAIMGAAAIVVVYSSFTMFKKALKAPRRGKSAEKGTKAVGAVSGNAGSKGASAGAAASASAVKAAAATAGAGDAPVIKLTPDFVAKAAFIGIIAGFLSGYVGVGGGFIMVPLFVAMLGIPMRLASGTSLTAVCILAIPGVIEQGILGNIDYMVGIAMMVGSIPGAVIGANLVKRVPERELRFLFAGFLLVAAVLLVLNESGAL